MKNDSQALMGKSQNKSSTEISNLSRNGFSQISNTYLSSNPESFNVKAQSFSQNKHVNWFPIKCQNSDI